MTGPYGSVANPVVLDPFRTIVEVHWPNEYLAISFRLKRTYSFNPFAIACEDGPSELPSAVFTTYIVDAQFDLSDGIASVYHGGKAGWTPVDLAEISASGLPVSPAAIAFDPWLALASSYDDPLDMTYPWARWQEVAGADLELTTPDGSHFVDTLISGVELISDLYTAGPSCYGNSVDGYFLHAPYTLIVDGPKNYLKLDPVPGSQVPISVSGLSVTWRDRSYEPIGVKTVGMIEFEGVQTSTGQLWVLLRKVVTP